MNVYHCSHDKVDFTGGITVQQKFLLTGTPEELLKDGTDYGHGFCPNCGRDCRSTKEEDYKTLPPGKDPYQPLHDQIAAAVADPDNPLTAEGAQAAFLEAVNK
jgi:hypothetical protein